NVIHVNLRRGIGIESGEKAMERSGASGFARRQTVAERLIAGRTFKQAFQQRAKVEAGATGKNRKPAAPGDLRDGYPRQACVFAGGAELVRIENIDQVMGNAASLGHGQFGGADVK